MATLSICPLCARSSRAVVIALLLIQGGITATVFAQGATIEVTPAGTAPGGSTVIVKWSGPNGLGDYITVTRKGADVSAYLNYKQTSDGRMPANPVSLVLPAEPGAYEIRYVTGSARRVLAAVPYEVSAITARVEGPASVAPDARFEVVWSGPNNGGDFVTIVAAGAAPRAYGSYVDARTGRADEKTGRSVATLRAPAKPGQYELRYVQQGSRVIGTRPIEVGSAAPSATAAGGAASSAGGAGAPSTGDAGAATRTAAGATVIGVGGAAVSGAVAGATTAAGSAVQASGVSAAPTSVSGAAASGAAAGTSGAAGGAAQASSASVAPITAAGAAVSTVGGSVSGAGAGAASPSQPTLGPVVPVLTIPAAQTPAAVATPITTTMPLVSAASDVTASLAGTGGTTAAIQSWPANANAQYVAQIRNQGLAAASGTTVSIPASSGLAKTSVTCLSTNGAQCPPGLSVSQIESGVAVPVLPSGGSVQFTIVTRVNGAVGSQASMTVTAAPPANTSDTNPANNSATASYPIAAPAAAATGALEFTSSGTFTVPAGVTRVVVELWGGGGGGGQGQSSGCGAFNKCEAGRGGGGGGSGAYTRIPLTVSGGSALEIAIGSGGAGNADGVATQLKQGGTLLATADGGKSGANGGAGGSASTAAGVVARAGNSGVGGASPPPQGGSVSVAGGSYGQGGGAGGMGGAGAPGTLNPVGTAGGVGGNGAGYSCIVRTVDVHCTTGAGLMGQSGGTGYALVTW
jgi:uncharacterized protein DUF11